RVHDHRRLDEQPAGGGRQGQLQARGLLLPLQAGGDDPHRRGAAAVRRNRGRVLKPSAKGGGEAMPQVGDIWESYRANEFVLIIDGTESPGVSKVSGLSVGEVETIEQPDGGSNHVYKIAAAKVKFEQLTIERYVDGSPEDKRFQ